jgi:aspartyl-tRNA(Asn)/glutamyl-tRNA(Gln) amidotransferase subunit C
MSLTFEEVEHVARLARLRLAHEELEKMRAQLSDILEHMAMLQELDVSDVAPTAQVTDTFNITRADEVVASLPREAALANAPEQAGGMFRVKPIFEDE